ncbi:MAG: MAPEG family protein, partial [Myxococcota bacterium]
AQLNTLEHMPPFLALLWLHAAFVSPGSATVAGGVYLASRVAHPLVMGSRLGRGVKLAILYATVPGYLVLAYLLGGLVTVLVAG